MTDPQASEDALETICELLTARLAGRATDETIEAAVARLVPNKLTDDDPQASDQEEEDAEDEASDEEGKKPVIDEDLENYDEEDGNNTASTPSKTAGKRKQDDTAGEATTTEAPPQPPPKRKRGRPRKTDPKKDWSAYKNIPFGKQGALMLATFGDSREPHIETVVAALEGTKKLVQAAVHDARKVRLEFLNNLLGAQKAMRKHKQEAPDNKGEWSSEVMYRALGRKSRNDNPNVESFTVEELKTLYPEEINVYDRWRLLREQAERSKGEEANKEEEEEEDEEEKVEKEKQLKEAPAAGKLTERSEQFDIRTDRMKQKRYLEFSEIRRGNFLGRAAVQVDESLAQKGQWAKLAPMYLRFLFWCGFDPQSSEPPPEAATIEALAFLAHSFLGRIVETAVRLHNQKLNGNTRVVEIAIGDHLQVADIENAMKEPDIESAQIFETSVVGVSTYFGPGFESRLELELDEMVKVAKNAETQVADDDLRSHLAQVERKG